MDNAGFVFYETFKFAIASKVANQICNITIRVVTNLKNLDWIKISMFGFLNISNACGIK